MSQRFSDAELAAEWWRAADDWNAERYGFPTGDEERWRRGNTREERFDSADERLDIIERFATLPHAHEEDQRIGQSGNSGRFGKKDPSYRIREFLYRETPQ